MTKPGVLHNRSAVVGLVKSFGYDKPFGSPVSNIYNKNDTRVSGPGTLDR